MLMCNAGEFAITHYFGFFRLTSVQY
jgi:hypothetical protein